MRRASKLWTVFGAVVLATTMTLPAAHGEEIGQNPAPTAQRAQGQVDVTRVSVPFSAAQSAADAVKITDVDGHPVVGYRFENPEIVGELSADPRVVLDDFLRDFDDRYGTQPEFVSAIIELPTDEAEARYSSGRAQVIESAGPAFEAVPVDTARIDVLLEGPRTRSAASEASRAGIQSLPAGVQNWVPEFADIRVLRPDPTRVFFDSFYSWNGTDTKTSNLSSHDGFEVEVNVESTNPDYQAGIRGGLSCPAGYKDQPFAKNYNFESWAVLVNTGSGLTAMASDVNAYADYNDATDDCNRNSIAIGFRTPQAIPSYSDGHQEIAVQITTFRGAENTGPISGVVQSVNSTGCVLQPWLSLTDCMGLTASSSGSRLTLNESNNWTAPPKCWWSPNYGTSGLMSYC